MGDVSTQRGPALSRAGERCLVAVVAGGRATRFGSEKLLTDLGGTPLIRHVLDGVRTALPAAHLVAVGLRPSDTVGVRWVCEDPPGGGPVAALAAALGSAPAPVDVVVVLAGDAPFSAGALPRLLEALDAAADGDGAIGVDPGGRRQMLLAALRADTLREAVAKAPAHGRSMRSVLAGLRLVEVPVDAREALDVDTPADLDAAASLIGAAAKRPRQP